MPFLPNGVFKLDGATEAPLSVGNKALDFKRLDQSGNPVSLSDYAGIPVVLLLVGTAGNDLTRERLEKLKGIAPQISASGAVPLVLADDHYSRNQALIERIGGVDYPVLDDQSEGYAALATYEQPIPAGTDHPLYVLDASHTIVHIRSGDDFLADPSFDHLAPYLRGSIPATPPVVPPSPVRPAANPGSAPR